MSGVDRIRYLLVTSGGLGRAKVASGTFGTLGGVAVALVLQALCPETTLPFALAVAAGVLLVLGCRTTAFVARTFPVKDPGQFVLDEVVGYLITVALWAFVHGAPPPVVHVVAFVVFRGFDVVKPFPARQLERLPGAPGIMLDDVAAGVYAGLALLALRAGFPGVALS